MNKLFTSSADPKQLSLTVRGILLAVLPILIALSGVDEATATGIVDTIVDITFYGTTLFSLVVTLYGLLRKIRLGRWSAEPSEPTE